MSQIEIPWNDGTDDKITLDFSNVLDGIIEVITDPLPENRIRSLSLELKLPEGSSYGEHSLVIRQNPDITSISSFDNTICLYDGKKVASDKYALEISLNHNLKP